MKLQCIAGTRLVAAVLTGLFLPALAVASITDFNTWDPVEDPYHENFTGSVDSASQITLRATAGPIPFGTDIGYQSVNGDAVADSTAGWAFDPSSDFSVSVDFSVFFEDPEGGFSLGMGIGVDRHGTDSAGILLARQIGGLLTFGGASRVNDATHSLIGLGLANQRGDSWCPMRRPAEMWSWASAQTVITPLKHPEHSMESRIFGMTSHCSSPSLLAVTMEYRIGVRVLRRWYSAIST
jgi:hypothetical protein